MAATEAGLRFLLNADVKDFERAQNDALKVAENAAKGIVAAGKQIAGSADYIKTLQASIKGLVADMKAGDARFVTFGTSVNNAGKLVNNFTKSTSNGAAGLTQISRIVQDAPFGFLAIGNNVTAAAESIGYLVTQTGSLKGALSSLGASFIGPGGIIFAISLLTTGLTYLVQRQQRLEAAQKKFKEDNKSVADVLIETNASVQGQIQTLINLGNIIKDTNNSYAQRKAALNELKKQDKDYFKGLSLEKSSYEQIKIAIDAYADSLVRAATLKGLEEQISKTAEAISKIAPVISNEAKKLAKDNSFSEFVANIVKDTSNVIPLQGAFKKLDDVINTGGRKLAKDIGDVSKQQLQAISKTAPLDELRERLRSFTEQLTLTISGVNTPDKGGAAAGKTISSVLKELDDKLKAIDASFKTVNFNLDDINEQKITALNAAFSDLLQLGLKPTSSEIKDITARVNLLNTAISSITDKNDQGKRLFDTKQLFQFNKQDITDPNGLKNERLVLRLPIDVDRSEVLKGAQSAAAKLREGILFIQGDFVDASEHLRKQLNDTLNSSIAGGIGNIASAIGEALGTGKINGIFSAFANSIASFLEEMGKVLIAEGVALEAFKASLESFQGAPAIIAGAALVIAGSAFRAFVAKGADSFATGGTIYGPSTVIAGDNVDGHKEHILSDLQLQKLGRDAGMGGGGGDVIAETRIEATQLVILLKRGGYQVNRIN